MDILHDPERRRKINEADLETLEKYRNHFSIGSWELQLVERRILDLRHAELRARPWYRTGIGWIAALTLVATIIGILIMLLR
ncbi:MAG TPA: hypothetical protein VH207_13200 [Chthoniobacterales bacterium]|nr:hypothetical protein [Chthoniobacterales bacterium]